MFRLKTRSHVSIFLSMAFLCLLLLGGCGDHLSASGPLVKPPSPPIATNKLSEVAPPPVLQELRQVLDQYQPQVSILSPQPDEVLSDPTVTVKFQVRDLPIFQDPKLGLGPHLHLILDNESYQAVYHLDEPVIINNLSPGTHTLRVFASRPWHESFKNNGAYAQTTFHVLTKTDDNAPVPKLPLLTYSRPKGNYGAEPILLDFYLTNAPIHAIAQENPNDDIADWRIRVTINGESFYLDTWQPIYLKGFEKGSNWIKLELLDEQANPINNAFNNTVRLITYTPNGQDTLSQLVRGELAAQAARSIVDPNARAPLTSVPVVPVTPTLETPPLSEPDVPEQPLPPSVETPSPNEIDILLDQPAQPSVETPSPNEIDILLDQPSPPSAETPSPTGIEIILDQPVQPSVETPSSNEIDIMLPAAETFGIGPEDTVEIVPEPIELPSVEATPQTTVTPTTLSDPTVKEITSQPIPDESVVNPSKPAQLPQWLKNWLERFKQIDSQHISQYLQGLKERFNF